MALLFMTAHKRCVAYEYRLIQAVKHVRLIKLYERERARNRRIQSKVEDFTAKAESLGLIRKHWDDYEVMVDEPLFFPKAIRILDQTIHTESYYFIPTALSIRKHSTVESGNDTEVVSAKTNQSTKKKGDILLTLKGRFVVRQR
jgi:hypothetical protein